MLRVGGSYQAEVSNLLKKIHSKIVEEMVVLKNGSKIIGSSSYIYLKKA